MILHHGHLRLSQLQLQLGRREVDIKSNPAGLLGVLIDDMWRVDEDIVLVLVKWISLALLQVWNRY
jgi:hypothetical protein